MYWKSVAILARASAPSSSSSSSGIQMTARRSGPATRTRGKQAAAAAAAAATASDHEEAVVDPFAPGKIGAAFGLKPSPSTTAPSSAPSSVCTSRHGSPEPKQRNKKIPALVEPSAQAKKRRTSGSETAAVPPPPPSWSKESGDSEVIQRHGSGFVLQQGQQEEATKLDSPGTASPPPASPPPGTASPPPGQVSPAAASPAPPTAYKEGEDLLEDFKADDAQVLQGAHEKQVQAFFERINGKLIEHVAAREESDAKIDDAALLGLGCREAQFLNNLQDALKGGAIGSAPYQEMLRELDEKDKKKFKAGTSSQKEEFKLDWCKRELEKFTASKLHTREWRRIDSEIGTYMTVERLCEEYGWWVNRVKAATAATNYAAKACSLGGKWISWCSWSKSWQVLFVKKSHTETFEQSWALFEKFETEAKKVMSRKVT